MLFIIRGAACRAGCDSTYQKVQDSRPENTGVGTAFEMLAYVQRDIRHPWWMESTSPSRISLVHTLVSVLGESSILTYLIKSDFVVVISTTDARYNAAAHTV